MRTFGQMLRLLFFDVGISDGSIFPETRASARHMLFGCSHLTWTDQVAAQHHDHMVHKS